VKFSMEKMGGTGNKRGKEEALLAVTPPNSRCARAYLDVSSKERMIDFHCFSLHRASHRVGSTLGVGMSSDSRGDWLCVRQAALSHV